MIIKQIQQLILGASEKHNANESLLFHLQDVLSAQGMKLSDESLEQAVRLVTQYINQVPIVFEQTIAIADRAGELENIIPLLESAAIYFFEPMDFIPDDQGLYGLLDDAYLTLRMLEKINDVYIRTCGYYLLPFDLASSNNAVRHFLGKQLVNRLDMEVAQAVERRAYEVSALEALSQRQYNSQQHQRSGQSGTYFEDDVARFLNKENVIIEDVYVDNQGSQIY